MVLNAFKHLSDRALLLSVVYGRCVEMCLKCFIKGRIDGEVVE